MSRLCIIPNDRSLSDRVATVTVLIVTMETNPVSLKQRSFVNNVHLIIELESNTPPYYTTRIVNTKWEEQEPG